MSLFWRLVGDLFRCVVYASTEAEDGLFTMQFDGYVVEYKLSSRWRLLVFS